MGIFNPSGEANLPAEQGIVDTSSANLISGVSGGLASTLTVGARGTKKTAGQIDDERNAELFRAMEFATAKSDPTARRSAQAIVSKNFLQDGGIFTDSIKGSLEAMTGQTFGTMTGKDEHGAAILEYKATEDYQSDVIAIKAKQPTWTNEQIDEAALKQAGVRKSAALETERIKLAGIEEWRRVGANNYDAALAKETEDYFAILTVGDPNADMLGAAHQIKAKFSRFMFNHSRPAAVEPEEFAGTLAKQQLVMDYIDNYIASNNPDIVKAKATLTLTEAVAKDKNSIEASIAQLAIINGDAHWTERLPEVLEDVNSLSADLDAQAEKDAIKNGTTPTKKLEATIEALPDNKKVDSSIAITELFRNVDVPTMSEQDTKSVASYLSRSMHALGATTGFVTFKTINESFSPKNLELLEHTLKMAPQEGANLSSQYTTVLEKFQVAGNSAALALASQGGYTVNPDGTTSVSPASLMDRLGEEKGQAAWATLQNRFNGDLDAAMASFNGPNFVRDATDPSFTDPSADVGAFNLSKFLSPLKTDFGRVQELKKTDLLINKRLDDIQKMQGKDELAGGTGNDTLASEFTVPDVVANDSFFLQGVSNIANNLGAAPEDLLRIMQFETGGSFDPAQRNAVGSGATGLIQFMPATAKSLGTTTDKLAQMSRVEQLGFVEKYFEGTLKGVKNPDISDLYMAVLWPRAVGKPQDYVLFRKGTKAYSQNNGLDLSGDGTITKAEATSKVLGRTGGGSGNFQGSFPVATAAPFSSPTPEARGGSGSIVASTGTIQGSVPSAAGVQAAGGASEGSQGAPRSAAQETGLVLTQLESIVEGNSGLEGGDAVIAFLDKAEKAGLRAEVVQQLKAALTSGEQKDRQAAEKFIQSKLVGNL